MLDGSIENSVGLSENRHVRTKLIEVIAAKQSEPVADVPDIRQDLLLNRQNLLWIQIINDNTIIIPKSTHSNTNSTSRINIVTSNLVEATSLGLPVIHV